MDELKKHIKMENLLQRKFNLIKSIEWAVNNKDQMLSEVSERELKVVLKQIKRLTEQN